MNYTELITSIQDICENTFTDAQLAMFVRQAEERIYNSVQLASLRSNQTGSLSAGNPYLSCPGDFLSVYSLAVIDASGEYKFLLNKDVNFIREAYPNPGSSNVSKRGLPRHYAIFGPATANSNELTFILGPTPDAAYSVELHYYFYPTSIVQAAISTLGTITGGSSYNAGTYFNVPLVGGSGSGATATVVISGGAVTSVTLSNPGVFYAVGNTLTVNNSDVGGAGAGFSIPVTAVLNSTGTTWLGDNFDPALLNPSLVEAIRFMKGEADLVTLYEKRYMDSLLLLKNLGDGKQRMDAYRDGQVRIPVQ